MIQNIRLGFATNSSSTHSIVFFSNPQKFKTKDSFEGTREYSFGWEHFTARSKETKLHYLLVLFYYAIRRSALPEYVVESVLKEIFPELDIESFMDSFSNYEAYIDHQSVISLPRNFSDDFPNIEFFNEFRDLILQENVMILGGNDNTSDKHPLLKKGERLDVLDIIKDAGNCWKVRKDPEYNYWCIFNTEDGTKLRMSFDKDAPPIVKSSRPELIDIKITDFCQVGTDCKKFCYQGSTPEGKHADIKYLQEIAYILEKMEVWEVACLEENTPVFGPNGMVKIKNLAVGDSIYDGTGKASKIKNIVKQNKDCVELKGNKGFKTICTEDHPFIVNNEIVEAKNLKGFCLDRISTHSLPESIPEIDLTKYIIPRSMVRSSKAKSGRGGNVGGKNFENGFCRLSPVSPITPSKIKITNDVMYLYGLSVAEGDRRGLTLHKKEIEFAKRAIEIYSSMLDQKDFGVNIELKNKNARRVEFKQSSIYESIFFKEMKIGYGCHNKTAQYLFDLDKELVRHALKGMFDGDGCYRFRKKVGFGLSYKTSSEKLAHELVYLLRAKFGVNAYFYKGENPIRKIEGRVLQKSFYYKIDVNGKINIEKLFPLDIFPEMFSKFPEYLKLKTNEKTQDDYIEIKSCESVGIKCVYDITLENESSHIYTISHGVLTHNCGGGEPTSHPEFAKIVKMFADKHIRVNFTTKSFAWLKNEDLRQRIIPNIGAFAYSASNARDVQKLGSLCEAYDISSDKVNVQVVMGTLDKKSFISILEEAIRFSFRVTLLGYKSTGFGTKYTPENYDWWFEVIQKLSKEHWFKVGIDTKMVQDYETLLEKNKVSNLLYTKEEGKFSCYIDAVEKKIAPSSFCDKSDYVDFTKTYQNNFEDIYKKF